MTCTPLECSQRLVRSLREYEIGRDDCARRIIEGLSRDGQQIQALPAYLSRPRADLSGLALVIDVGGTNMRAGLVEFVNGRGKLCSTPVRAKAKTGRDEAISGEEFFGAQAQLAAQLNAPQGIPVGYCFSYPAAITPELDAVLLRWTKGLHVSGVVGTLVGEQLRRALNKVGVKPGKIVVLNDTVAALQAGAITDAVGYDHHLGFIAGTGLNLAGLTPTSLVTKLPEKAFRGQEIAINLELGNYDQPLYDVWDARIDEVSDDPGRQRLEKAAAGYYLPYVYQHAAEMLPDYIPHDFDCCQHNSCKIVELAVQRGDVIAQAVLRRSAMLMAMAMAGYMKVLGKGHFSIAVEGSLYWNDPIHTEVVPQVLRELIAPEQSFAIHCVSEANFIGSACAALVGY